MVSEERGSGSIREQPLVSFILVGGGTVHFACFGAGVEKCQFIDRVGSGLASQSTPVSTTPVS